MTPLTAYQQTVHQRIALLLQANRYRLARMDPDNDEGVRATCENIAREITERLVPDLKEP